MLVLDGNKIEPHFHTLKSQLEDDEPAQFKIHALKGAVLDDVLFQADFESSAPLTAKGVRVALLHGVKGCRNVVDGNNEEINFTPQLLASLCWGDRQELAMAAVNKSKLNSEEKEKN